MRNTACYVLVCICIVAAGLTKLSAQQKTDTDRVRAANEAFYTLISNEDVTQFEMLWSQEPYARAIHPVSQQVEKGWDTVRETFTSIFTRYDNIQVKMPEPQIRVSNDMAWVTGEEEFRAVSASNDEQIAATLLGTNVFEKHGDQWLMVHHHVSVAATP